MVTKNSKVRSRFAPSPTGFLHVGGLRTALYAYLFAKQNGGKFLLRIEDTDRERFVADGTLNIINSLNWAGLKPDEGVVGFDTNGKMLQQGSCGPYVQSERLETYKKYADKLLADGNAYYCFCTAERLAEVRERQQKNKLALGYDGECRKLDSTDAIARVTKGEPHVVRLKMPKEGETVFNDLIRGEVKFKNELVDDQVLVKTDGFPTYHLAVVVDDHLMEITHVIRGEEWVSSTPKHIQLYKYLDWEAPIFAHLPLLLNADKSKLSKRQGDVAVEDYRQKGYLPEALINFVAFLGWNPGTEQELYSMDELIKDFSFEKVGKTGAVFNLEKLDWYNREYLKLMSSDKLVELAKPWLASVIPNPIRMGEESLSQSNNGQRSTPRGIFDLVGASLARDDRWLASVLALEKERVTTLAELPEAIKFIFESSEYPKELLVWRKGSLDEVKKVLPELKDALSNFSIQWSKAELEIKIGEWIKAKEYSTGSVLWPLRVALSGQQNSPGPHEIAEVLGKDETLRRIDVAISKLS